MATRTIANGGGNYNATGTWVEGAVPTSADDVVATGTSGNLTVTAAAAAKSINFTNYVGTFVINSGQTLTVSGSVTLAPGMTWTASTGTLTIGTAGTLTFNGINIPCAFTCTAAITLTLGDSGQVNGLVTTGNNSNTTINGNTLTCAGGHTCSSATQGTTQFIYTGGNLSSSGQTSYTSRQMRSPFSIAGNVTLSNNFLIAAVGTYTSGTITPGAYAFQLGGNTTLNGAWPNNTPLDFRGTATLTLGQNQTLDDLLMNANATLTLAGNYDLTLTSTTVVVSTGTIALNRSTHNFGTLTINQGITGVFSGAYNPACVNFRQRAGATFHFTSGQVLNVSGEYSICGCAGATTTFRATTGSSGATVTFSGTVDNLSIYRATITDITFTNACYGYFSGAFTRTSGITDFTSNPSFYSDPGVANVAAGVTYQYGAQTNNRTGTYDPVTGNYTDPGVANVADGVQYVFAGFLLTGTYDPGGAVFTDPGAANVKSGVSYTFNDVLITGTYDPIVPLADITAAARSVVLDGSPAPTPSDPPTASDIIHAVAAALVP